MHQAAGQLWRDRLWSCVFSLQMFCSGQTSLFQYVTACEHHPGIQHRTAILRGQRRTPQCFDPQQQSYVSLLTTRTSSFRLTAFILGLPRSTICWNVGADKQPDDHPGKVERNCLRWREAEPSGCSPLSGTARLTSIKIVGFTVTNQLSSPDQAFVASSQTARRLMRWEPRVPMVFVWLCTANHPPASYHSQAILYTHPVLTGATQTRLADTESTVSCAVELPRLRPSTTRPSSMCRPVQISGPEALRSVPVNKHIRCTPSFRHLYTVPHKTSTCDLDLTADKYSSTLVLVTSWTHFITRMLYIRTSTKLKFILKS